MAPCDGERRFTSAMRPTSGVGSWKSRTGGAAAARRSSSAALPSRVAILARVTARIASSVGRGWLPGILAFGRYSGRLCFGIYSGANMPVTRRQREILDYITKHIEEKGYAPSFEEIARQFGFQSLATVHEHLTNLERKGYIRRTHNESRAIEVVPPKGQTGATELPLLGLVAAGAPIEAVTGEIGRARLNSSHTVISYAVFCLKKKKTENQAIQ